ncbi:MAG TPA: MaoC/PaaZ C-terminal domain-containing protein [Acidimicrobiia bacterium]|nr:MaoC/PaaZ C-terminal domain-containing protein [Acidimicrobiia bacterium]
MAPFELNVAVGEEIASEVRGPITRGDIARYATTINDFNPIHLDDEFARSAGFAGPIVHGPLVLGHLVMMVARWAGLERITRVSGRLVAPTPVGQKISCTATVAAVREGEDGVRYADVDLSAAVDGRQTAVGQATVRLS